MIKIQWLASIWRQNDQKCWVTSQNIQNNTKLQNRSNYNELHRVDVKTIKTKLNYKCDQNSMTCIDWMSKQSKQKLNYKSDQNPMTCIDLTSKRSKMLSYVAKQQRKTIKNCIDQKNIQNNKLIKLQWIASIGCQNDRNKAKLQMWSKSNDLHQFDVKTFKLHECKTIKTKPNYKSNQNPITCIDWMSKRWKQS